MESLLASGDFVKLNVSNSKNDNVSFEQKFLKSLTVSQLKSKLENLTGASANTMQLELYNGDRLVAKLSDNDQLLGSFTVNPGMRLHVVDSFVWITEEPVAKFELTDEQYESKGGTIRGFLKTNRLGKYNEEVEREKEAERLQKLEEESQREKLITINSRCKVTVKNNPTRLGTVKYKGPIEGKTGTFVGVQYDEPLGKNNGSIDGKVYFECQPKYGGFVSPLAVEIGDFPPEDSMSDDEI